MPRTTCCSYTSGVYTLLFHSIIVCCETVNLSQFMNTYREKILSILLLIFSAVCVVSSVLLLIGIWMDIRDLSIPWIISIIMTTILDSFYCLYLVFEAEFAVLIILLFSTDIVISVLNVYCVISHLWMYYMPDRGHPVAREIQAPEEQEYRSADCFMPSPGDPVASHSSAVAEIHYSGEVIRNEDKSLEIELQESPDNHRDGVAWNENLDDLMKDCKEVLNDLIEKMMEGMVEPIK